MTFAPISIVIPTLNAAAGLPDCLASLVPGLRAGMVTELIVSDGGSADDTVDIALGSGATIVTGEASRGGQLRRGAEAARGEWLLFLHADTRLEVGWEEECASLIDSNFASAAAFSFAFTTSGIAQSLVAFGANFRARVFGLPYGDQGLFVSRKTYADTGGYADQKLMEDVDLVDRVKAKSGAVRILKSRAYTSPARYEKQGYGRRVLRNLTCLLRYRTGTPADVIAAAYD